MSTSSRALARVQLLLLLLLAACVSPAVAQFRYYRYSGSGCADLQDGYPITVVADACVEGVFKVECLGAHWAMKIYKAGQACKGPVLDVVVGDLQCSGSRVIDCGFVLEEANGSPLSRQMSAAVGVLVATASLLLLARAL